MTEKKFAVKNSWIFNWKLDLLSFVVPFIVAYFFIGTKYNSVDNYWLSYFLAKIFIGGGHIFATYIPFATGPTLKKRLDKKFYIIPVIFVGIYAIANLMSDVYFMNLLAITGLAHIYLQHHAWLKMSQGKLSQQRKKFERFFFLVVMGLPNFIWFFRQLENRPSYLYGITITQSISDWGIFTPGFLSVFTAIALLISFGLGFRKEDNVIVLDFARLIYFLATTIWMCFGLFFIKSLGFFHVYLAISHGISYMAYISLAWPKHLENGVWNSHYKFAIVCLVSLIFGLMWVGSFYLFKWTPRSLIFLPWVPLLVHYSYDSIIWRKFQPKAASHE